MNQLTDSGKYAIKYSNLVISASEKRHVVTCKVCGATSLAKFSTEVAIHSNNLDRPHVFVFPEILVCLNCGKPEFAEVFVVPEDELRSLAKRDAARG